MKKNIGTIFVLKSLFSIIFTLIILIIIKANSNFRSLFYQKVYSNNFNFTYFKGLYEKYVGDLNFLEKIPTTKKVFNETLEYSTKAKYLDGVNLTISKNYLVPINESGTVVFIGEKEGYNNIVIIQRIDGIDEWYGNLENINVSLYDYVEKGTLLAQANNNLYLVYKKNGNILDYEEYIK